jgi:hypothetical protein
MDMEKAIGIGGLFFRARDPLSPPFHVNLSWALRLDHERSRTGQLIAG